MRLLLGLFFYFVGALPRFLRSCVNSLLVRATAHEKDNCEMALTPIAQNKT
jgi:hypothetical protein